MTSAWRWGGACLALAASGAVCDAAPPDSPPRRMAKPVIYQSGPETVLVTGRAGPAGTVIQARLPLPATAGEGLVLTVPSGSLARETRITLSVNAGTLSLRSGVAAETVFRIAAEGVSSFEKPVLLKVYYDAVRWKNHILVGYAIGPEGELSPVDLGTQDHRKGEALFYTRVPLLFTWAYVKA
ncbi:hypothetical protein WJU23_13200 [Prosthecobacter sp. SYSU 5D2]|uniref:hypothetical protein n=1 Tax=Prosthecobacter sp. SYSU 5D2 TaxID=3134134 RepID=UPI0031FE5862